MSIVTMTARALGFPLLLVMICCLMPGQTALAQMPEFSGGKLPTLAPLVPFEFRSPDQLEEAFARFARERADALLVPPDVTFTTHRRRIANLALDARGLAPVTLLPGARFDRKFEGGPIKGPPLRESMPLDRNETLPAADGRASSG